MNFNICTHPTNPTILLPEDVQVPDGYTVEGQTSNPNYLTETAVPDYGRRITKLAFRNRFTANEKTLIDLAAQDDPTADIGTRMNSAFIRSSLTDLAAASYVDLDRDDTRSGVMAMEAHGLLATGRAIIILDTPVTAVEVPTYPGWDL